MGRFSRRRQTVCDDLDDEIAKATQPTKSQLKRTPLDWKSFRAAVFVGDASRKCNPSVGLTEKELEAYVLLHSSKRLFAKTVVLAAHLALALFEPPETIRGVHPFILSICEFLCVMFYCFELVLKFSFKKRNTASKWTWAKVVIVLLVILDIAVQLITNFTVIHFTRCLRPFFLIEEVENLRRLLRNVVRTITNVFDVIFLQILTVLMFSSIAYIIEGDEVEDPPFIPDPTCIATYPFLNTTRFEWERYCIVHEGNCQKFAFLPDAITRFFVLVTTANFPDVMMCMYTRSWWYSLLFIIFLILSTFFLMQLIVAVVYSQYLQHSKDMALTRLQKIRKSLDAAFEEIRVAHTSTVDGVVTMEGWRNMFRFCVPNYSPQLANFCFHLMDDDEAGVLTRSQFYMVFDLLHLDIKQKHRNPVVSRPRAALNRFRQLLKPIATSFALEVAVNFAIVLNIALLLVSVRSVHKTKIRNVIVVFPFIFAAEMVLKMLVHSPAKFLRTVWNRMDAVITVVGVCGYLASFSTRIEAPHSVGNTVLALRMFRICRMLGNFSRFNLLYLAVSDIFRTLRAFLMLQLCFFFVFAVLGMELFANTVTTNHCACLGCPLKMYDNTFNNIATAFVTLFELMAVNNWQYNMDMHVNALGTRWVRVYFLVFYFLSVLIMMSLVTAFILEAFLLEWELNTINNSRHNEIVEIARRIKDYPDLHPYKFTVVSQRMGLTAVLFDIHKDDLAQATETLDSQSYNPVLTLFASKRSSQGDLDSRGRGQSLFSSVFKFQSNSSGSLLRSHSNSNMLSKRLIPKPQSVDANLHSLVAVEPCRSSPPLAETAQLLPQTSCNDSPTLNPQQIRAPTSPKPADSLDKGLELQSKRPPLHKTASFVVGRTLGGAAKRATPPNRNLGELSTAHTSTETTRSFKEES